MKQREIDQLVRDVVTTLKDAGVTVQRMTDWSRGGNDSEIRSILRRHDFTAQQIDGFLAKSPLTKADEWAITRERK